MVNYEVLVKGLNLRPVVGFIGYSSVVLIKDEQEKVLVDTGNNGVRLFLYNRLKDEEITKIFISHLHFDHCANLNLFPKALVYINGRELDFLEENKFNCLFRPIIDNLSGIKIVRFDSEQKITSNVKMIFTFGHSVGHSSLEFEGREGKIIIAGDAIRSYREFIYPEKVEDCYNKKQFMRTVKSLKRKYKMIIPGHAGCIKNGKVFRDNAKLIAF